MSKASSNLLSPATRHIPGLDGLRGLAVLLVVNYHFGLLRFGWTGVWLFFVLSGYLITSILLETRSEGIATYLGRFYWRRALRILPIYLGFVGLVTAAWLMTGYPTGVGEQFPWLATFTFNIYMSVGHKVGLEQAFHHLWSISTEEQFYLVWPLLIFLLGRKGIGWFSLILILASPIVRYLEPAILESIDQKGVLAGKFIYYFPLGHFDAFAMGGAIAAFIHGPWRGKANTWGWLMCLPSIAIATSALVQYFSGVIKSWPIHLGFLMSSTEGGFHIWGYSAVTLLYGGCLILVLFGSQKLWIKRMAEWGPARETGKISYGMYVFHWPLLLLMERYLPLHENLFWRLVQFVGYMIVLTAISWLSYRFYESWFLGKKETFFAQKDR